VALGRLAALGPSREHSQLHEVGEAEDSGIQGSVYGAPLQVPACAAHPEPPITLLCPSCLESRAAQTSPPLCPGPSFSGVRVSLRAHPGRAPQAPRGLLPLAPLFQSKEHGQVRGPRHIPIVGTAPLLSPGAAQDSSGGAACKLVRPGRQGDSFGEGPTYSLVGPVRTGRGCPAEPRGHCRRPPGPCNTRGASAGARRWFGGCPESARHQARGCPQSAGARHKGLPQSAGARHKGLPQSAGARHKGSRSPLGIQGSVYPRAMLASQGPEAAAAWQGPEAAAAWQGPEAAAAWQGPEAAAAWQSRAGLGAAPPPASPPVGERLLSRY